MGMLKLNQLMSESMRRRNRRRHIQTRTDGSTASCAKRKGGSPSQHDGHSLDGQIKGYSGSYLPEDILFHIHSLMPIRDAARAACVSRTFLRSWRCRPNLDFSRKTLGLINDNTCRNEETRRDITSVVDHILQNHYGIGVKAVKFQDDPYYNIQDFCYLDLEVDSFYNNQADFCHLDLDRWLGNTIKPGIEELNISLYGNNTLYNFPCSLLSDEIGESLRNLQLVGCHIHPTIILGSLRNLRRMQLCNVSITESELEYLLSNSFSLEQLVLRDCSGIICLKIPCLQRLSYLEVNACLRLKVIESKARNLSSVRIAGDLHVELETSCIIKYFRSCPGAALYARTELPSSMPNLETLILLSETETVNTSVMPSKFLHLKSLSISLHGGQTYDCFSLLSFLDASPFLETLNLNVSSVHVERVSVFEDPSDLRKMPENRNDKLKCVRITSFTSAKSLIELTCHILESAMSLECLTLDTTHGVPRCSVMKHGSCWPMTRDALVKAHRALMAVQTYVKPKVPSTVELNVLEPCSQCHAVAL